MSIYTSERFNGMIFFASDNERENYRERYSKRLLAYYTGLQEKATCPATFWDRESDWETTIYNWLKGWEKRHPISGIILCTILSGILISLLVEIILKAICFAL